MQRCARFRPGDLTQPVEATKAALRTLARQHLALSSDLDAPTHALTARYRTWLDTLQTAA